jgi:TonB-linked SusC/RagA family outer membrane protein
MRKITALLLVCLLAVGQVWSQTRTVTGKVTDDKGDPIVGVSVAVKGTNVGTATNDVGVFSLNVPADARTITFSSINFKSKEFGIGNRTNFEVNLESNAGDLDEVVVVGYTTRRKIEEGGAISQVKGKDIANLPNVSVDRALQGRAAGVLVQANNGIPGGAINVRIRGTATFGAGTQPLYIIDGVQFNNRIDGSFTQNNPLAFLNPNDIESIEVLKDGASASIYGAQAANGVVLITTKNGRAGKTQFTFNVTTGTTNALKKFDMLSSQEYVNMRAEADFNRWSPQARSAGVAYPFLESQRWALGELSSATGSSFAGVTSLFNQRQADSMIAALPNFDWQDESIQTGQIQNVDFSMTGGSDKNTFILSANYTKQSTIFDKVDFQRFGGTLGMVNKISNRVTLRPKLILTSYEQKIPFSTDGAFLGSPMFSAPLIVPVNRVRNTDESYFGLPPSQALAGILNQNIIAVNDFNSGYQRTNQFVGSLGLDVKVATWLTYRGFASMDYRLTQGASYRDPRTNDGFGVQGRGSVQSNWNTNLLTNHTLNWVANITPELKADGLVGFEYRNEVNEGISAAGIGFPSQDFRTINAAATPESVGEFWSSFRRVGYFGRFNLNYSDKYILSLIGRRDGSSRFGASNKFGNFWGVIGSWNMHRENFLQSFSALSLLRLRASAGTTGRDNIGNFDALSLYVAGSQYNGGAGIQYGGLGNANLGWEISEDLNLGLDFGLFNNRINGSVEVFQKNTKNALLDQPVSWTTGAGSFSENVGEIRVRGTEVTLGVDVLKPARQSGLSWNINFTFAYLHNEVTQLYGGNPVLPADPSVIVGRSIGSIFTQVYQGVNAATGRPVFLDTFNNSTYIPIARDRRYIGDTEPDFFGGLTNTFRYKGFEITGLFIYEFGRMASDGQVNFMLENGNRTFNGLRFPYENRWQKPGDITAYPRIFDTGVEPGGVNHVTGSSRLWRKADFIRLRDIRLAYNFTPTFLKKMNLTNAVFFVQGQNLITFSDWWGYDPEFVGTSTGIIPQTKNLSVGLQVGF